MKYHDLKGLLEGFHGEISREQIKSLKERIGEYDYDTTVAYPFGYGLSYTTFDYANFTMTENADSFTFTVDVTNTGDVDGREVVEIYANNNKYMDVVQGLLAGGDTWDCNDATKWTDKLKEQSGDPKAKKAQ